VEEESQGKKGRGGRRGKRTLEAHNIPRKLDDSDLETKADTEVGNLLLTSPLGRRNHTLRTAKTETTGNEDTAMRREGSVSSRWCGIKEERDSLGSANGLPSGVELLRPFVLSLSLKIRRLNPSHRELATALHRSVLERLDNRGVRVLEGGVLADEDDRNLVEQAVVGNGELLPVFKEGGTASDTRFGETDEVETEALLEELEETLVLEEEGDVVEGGNVVNGEDLLVRDVAEHGDLRGDGEGEGFGATAGDDVGGQTETTEVTDRSLSWLRLELAVDRGNEGDVNEGEVVLSDTELELTHRLDEGSGLDVTDGSTELRREKKMSSVTKEGKAGKRNAPR
jgi:hypothetical protein